MSFPQGPGNGNNPNPNNNRNNGNPFTNPFNRGNNGNNGKGNNNENRPIWQSPWLWGAVLVVMVVLMFQMFAGGGTKTIDTKDGFALINQGKATYAEITDNKQVVRLELKNDYTKKNADTGKVTNYGKNVQFYYTFAQGAQVAKAVENGDLEKGWTSNIEQTSVMSYLITSILPFVIHPCLVLVADEPHGRCRRHARHGWQEKQRQAARGPDPHHQVRRCGR